MNALVKMVERRPCSWYGVVWCGGVACVGARLARAAKAGTNSLAFATSMYQ